MRHQNILVFAVPFDNLLGFITPNLLGFIFHFLDFNDIDIVWTMKIHCSVTISSIGPMKHETCVIQYMCSRMYSGNPGTRVGVFMILVL